MINEALCRLLTSGLLWHEMLSDCLRDMGYEPCKMESDVWLRYCGEHYECIAVYVDDLLIASKNPHGVLDDLTKYHHFKLKGTGLMFYHLGCDF